MFEIAQEAISLVKSIIEMAQQGASSAQIRKKLAAPGGVAQPLLDAIQSRKDSLKDYISHG